MLFKKKEADEPVPIGKIAVIFKTGPVEAYCETDLMGYYTINVDNPEEPFFDPDFDTLSASIKTALAALTASVDQGLVDDILTQLQETRNEDS